MALDNGSRVGVIGGGPAGSLCATFLIAFARQRELDLRVDIYEPRDFTMPGPTGCNMCGGIVSETLVQALVADGIRLPPTVVQQSIDSYVLHTDTGTVKIDAPSHEKRIAAVRRGGGPRRLPDAPWGGLDGYLLDLARSRGARVVRSRVTDASWEGGRPRLHSHGGAQAYDLVVGAVGVNSSAWPVFDTLGLRHRPATTRAYITELDMRDESIALRFGSSMHVFLLRIPRLDFAAIIPKRDFLTVCLLGRDVDAALVNAFFTSRAVRACFPAGWTPTESLCHCGPKINVREATQPFTDRVVLVGECGVTRLYKDGLGAAYTTAKAAAAAAVFGGVAAADFRRHYWPLYGSIARDNRFGRLTFAIVQRVKSFRPLLRGVVAMASTEQTLGLPQVMSGVLWDLFTGSAPYRGVFLRTLAPRFLGRFLWETARATRGREERQGAVPPTPRGTTRPV